MAQRAVISTPFDTDDMFDDGSAAVAPEPKARKTRKTKTPVEDEPTVTTINVHTGEEIGSEEKPLPKFVHMFVCTKKGCRGKRPTTDYDPDRETVCPVCSSPMTRHYWAEGGRKFRTDVAA